MIVGYLDEAGHSSQHRVVAMGGIIGSDVDMPRLGIEWLATLKRHSCTTFHMSQLESRVGDFEGWNEDQKRALLRDAIQCLAQFPLCYFGVGVITARHRSLAEELARIVGAPLGGSFQDPWFLCFQLAISTIARVRFWRKDDRTMDAKIAVFHDQQAEYEGRAVDGFQYLKDATDYGYRLGTCTPGDKRDIIQLQPADLVAYETRKLLENVIYDPSRKMRWPMQQIRKGISVWNYADLGGAMPRIPGSPLAAFRVSHVKLVDGVLKIMEGPQALGEGI